MLLRPDEQKVVDYLALAWNSFLEMGYDGESQSMYGPFDEVRREFMQAIHTAQRVVLARPAQRAIFYLPEKESK